MLKYQECLNARSGNIPQIWLCIVCISGEVLHRLIADIRNKMAYHSKTLIRLHLLYLSIHLRLLLVLYD